MEIRMSKERIRCGIYTRKSTEEGLEQSFNSLEAQREACVAYIHSQKHEGWEVLTNRYDDGGFSGGTMERPGLKRLLSDVQAGKIDIIVVYKVDRLTRSLADFAKIIEILDSHKISFVSVTQHFNTTTSMGRLTLNVLLSFAQFEREITGERIRDKIAASKKKGMWMGGNVALGYDCVDRRLVINPLESEKVRQIFRAYVRLGSVRKLKGFLDHKRVYSKARRSNAGRSWGGGSYSRGALYHLLNNRIYLGEVVHRGHSYPGQHEAIVARDLWNQAATLLKENNQAHRTRKSQSTPSLLAGKLFDCNGVRFTPTHAVKDARRYRYYTSQTVVQQAGIKPAITRFPAQELEQFLRSQVQLLLQKPDKFMAGTKDSPSKWAAAEIAKDLAREWPGLAISKQNELVRSILRRVTISRSTLWMEIDKGKLLETLLSQNPEAIRALGIRKPHILKLRSDFQVFRRRGELRVVAPHNNSCFEGTPVPSLVKAVARARDWYERLVTGEFNTVAHLAQKVGLTQTYVRRILQCANLSPQITEALLTGKHRPNITLKQILHSLPLGWPEQEKRFLNAI
jgi:DNA invertase Pin-like site-specific DNA recombinase